MGMMVRQLRGGLDGGAMAGKYAPLTRVLRAAAQRGQAVMDLSFDQVAQLVGGLPTSADQRQWWANTNHSQGMAWRAAGFRVDAVSLDRRRVRFVADSIPPSVGDARTHTEPGGAASRASGPGAVPGVRPRPATGPPVDVRVVLQWLDAGAVILDEDGKLRFGDHLVEAPGLYRMTLVPATPDACSRMYIGETDNLRRRLRLNYRSPGVGQQTNLRINALLGTHLGAGGVVELAVVTEARVWIDGAEQSLDLSRKSARLLAENCALAAAHGQGDVELVNL
jgi:hypothetical protein